ncbi:hypothetical protein AB1Y20_008112 [Prymnesium parvum]|uniref:Eukaryotic translation initiation factor 3 subunit B n=1 Tax=Prymnesium parvum TaxID=97485 RepID=A0AB34IWB1_PRYPA|mmetsp:Transcript_4546/g.9951  ORF Transcript_4546/g.9951 Transcript_4546/m.9951 type:complete len:678 (+) Transcript_4546:87-2120(+)
MERQPSAMSGPTADEDLFDEEEPQIDTSFKDSIFVDGLPIVPTEKKEKLVNVVRKFFSQVGQIRHLEMPMDKDDKNSLGYALIEFQSEAEALAATQKANGYKLDKSHTFIVNSLEDYYKYAAVPDEETEFVPPEYVPGENLSSWLMDEGARDQFVVRYNDETEIWWNDPAKPNNAPCYSKTNWSDAYVSWSPHGKYLATFHRLGIVLWGGPSWKKLLKLNHGGVKLIDFSPCEKFIVTWSPETDQAQALIVWETATGQKLRAFQGAKPEEQLEWPVFKWSHDDRLFARLGDDCIYVYGDDCKLIKDKSDKRSSVKVDGVRQFVWSPTDNVVSLWVPEHTNNPAKVVLMELPSRTEVRQKNLFSVADLRMTWHDQGHFLCVKVDKHSKSKKTLNSVFELFRFRDKEVPIEVSEFSKDSSIIAFAWEPKGIRFAVIHSEAGSARTDVSLYTMGSKYNGKVSLLKTFEKKNSNTLFWSPAGHILLLANLKGTAGQLEWIDTNALQTIGEAEHFMCSNIEWDPTGRYVATWVAHWRHQMENGYNLWSSHGRPLGHIKHEKFYQLIWRPRPPSLLSEAQEKEIRKDLRSYSKKYEEEDRKLKLSMQGDRLKLRKQQHADFEKFIQQMNAIYNAEKQARMELRDGAESDNSSAYTLVEDIDEQELSYVEENLGMDESIEIGDD